MVYVGHHVNDNDDHEVSMVIMILVIKMVIMAMMLVIKIVIIVMKMIMKTMLQSPWLKEV